MTEFEIWLASGGSQVLIPTVEIQRDSAESLFLYPGIDEIDAKDVDGTALTFQPSQVDIALRKKDNSGNQSLSFGFENVTGQVLEYLLDARSNQEEIRVIYRAYLDNNLNEPAEKPARFTVTDISAQGDTTTVTAGYQDVITTAFNRLKYRSPQFPGLLYFSS